MSTLLSGGADALYRGDGAPSLSPCLPAGPDPDRIRRAIDEAEPVFVVDERDARPLLDAGLAVYPLPHGLSTLEPPSLLRTASIALVTGPLAKDVARAERFATAFLAAEWACVKLLHLPTAPSQWFAEGGAATSLRRLEELTPKHEISKAPKVSQGAWLTQHAREHLDLFHSPDGEAYALLPTPSGGRAVCRIGDAAVADFLNLAHLSSHNAPANRDAISQTRDQLSALARLRSPMRDVHIRAGREGERIYVDLGNESWRVVEVTANGWRVLNPSPVMFRRVRTTLALPLPQLSEGVQGTRDALALVRKYVRLVDDEQYALLFAFLAYAFSDERPYMHLSLVGGQDSGKSTAMEFIKRIVDPERPIKLNEPKSDRDLYIAASRRLLPAFDNLSSIQPWLSDVLCSLTTGGGFTTRRLNTDEDEVSFDVARPVLTNGIVDLATRPDLASRTLTLRVESIKASERVTLSKLLRDFEADHPRILGGILDLVSAGLRTGATLAENLPTDCRAPMLAGWAEAARSLYPIRLGVSFADALARNQMEASVDAVEVSIVGRTILRLLDDTSGYWKGSTQALMEALRRYVPDPAPRDFPSTVQKMRTDLERVAPMLEKLGVTCLRARERGGSRTRFVELSTPSSIEEKEGIVPIVRSGAEEP